MSLLYCLYHPYPSSPSLSPSITFLPPSPSTSILFSLLYAFNRYILLPPFHPRLYHFSLFFSPSLVIFVSLPLTITYRAPLSPSHPHLHHSSPSLLLSPLSLLSLPLSHALITSLLSHLHSSYTSPFLTPSPSSLFSLLLTLTNHPLLTLHSTFNTNNSFPLALSPPPPPPSLTPLAPQQQRKQN